MRHSMHNRCGDSRNISLYLRDYKKNYKHLKIPKKSSKVFSTNQIYESTLSREIFHLIETAEFW